MAAESHAGGEERLRPVALQNAPAILVARQGGDRELLEAREALEQRTEALVQSLAMMRATLESTTDGILVTDIHGKVTDSNEKFAEMWSIPRELMESKPGRRLIEVCSRLVADPSSFRARLEQIYAAAAPETCDLLELSDGRAIERFSKTQRVGDRQIGRVWTFRDITERRQAEAALRESEARFRGTFEQAAVGIAHVSVAGVFLRVNAKLCEIVGYGQDELLGKTFAELTVPEDRPAGEEARRAMLAGEQRSYTVEKRYRRKSGEVVEVNLVTTLERTVTGEPKYFISVVEDITARKQTEKALRQSDEKFHQLADHINDAFWISSPDLGAMHFISVGYEAIWGRSAESLYAHPHQWIECIVPEDRDTVFAVFATLMGDKTEISVEYRIVRPDGTVRWVRDRGFQVRDAAGNLICISGIASDITEQREAEEALRLTQTSVEQSPDGVWWLDSEARFVYANEAACRSLGYSREELLAMKLPQVFPDFRIEDWSALWMNRTLKGVLEGVYRAKDGRLFPVEVIFSPVVFAGREVVCAYTRDITERTQADAALARVHRRLLDASRQAGMAEVATSVLHDVGNVLTSVNVSCSFIAGTVRRSHIGNVAMAAGLLREHEGDLAKFLTSDPRGRKLPDFLRKLAARLVGEQVTVLEEIRLLSQNIEHIKKIVERQQYYGKASRLTEPVTVTELVEESLRLNAGSLALHRVQTVREYSDVPPITVEKHKALQILVNVIRNASHACAEARRPDKQITVRVAGGRDCVRVAIIDNGVGIPPENLTRIFSHGFTTRKDGHGFGLHSAVLAAQEMGGGLTARSDGPGTGATFTLELPLAPGGHS